MKRVLKPGLIALAAAVGLAGAGAYGAQYLGAQTAETITPAPADGVSRDAYVQSAVRMFDRVDLDGDVVLSENEFAAYLLAEAELTRLNNAAEVIEGVRYVADLPTFADAGFTPNERETFVADARAEYNAAAGNDGRMSVDEFVTARIGLFDRADQDRDGVLDAREVEVFVAHQSAAPRFTTGV